ncbi:MAG: hypothetical protein JST90_04635 [Bacteroidetes bacterium]|nr:hypothetical protein [Bacteroidota bacterium]
MKSISSNRNGDVFQIAKQGFSVKKVAKQILSALESAGAIVESIDYAATGSVYIELESEENICSIRISNHTKRGFIEGVDTLKAINERKMTNVRNEVFYSTDIEILNTDMRNEVIEALKNGTIKFK